MGRKTSCQDQRSCSPSQEMTLLTPDKEPNWPGTLITLTTWCRVRDAWGQETRQGKATAPHSQVVRGLGARGRGLQGHPHRVTSRGLNPVPLKWPLGT